MAFALVSRSRSKPQGSVKPAPQRKSARGQHSADSRFGFAKPVVQPPTAVLPTAPVMQTKVKVGEPNDKFGQEADQVAEVTGIGNGSMLPSAAAQSRSPVGNLQRLYGNQPVLQMRHGSGGLPAPSVPLRSSQGGILQRKCACGGTAGMWGECAECSKKTRLGLQTKLRVNEAGDVYEQEADRIADQVMATPAHHAISSAPPRIQRFAGHPARQAEAAPAGVDQALASPGRPLEPAVRQDMEQRFGHDFSRVRVHSDATAEQSAQDVNARAYTVGHNIVFGAGQHTLGSREGQKLLAHELTHVVQQSTASAPSVVQRQAGGGAPAGGAPAGTAPAGSTPAFSVKYNGCGRAPYTQAVVEAAARAAYSQVVSGNCIRSQKLRDEILSEFANLTIDCEQGSSSSPCGMAWRFLSHTVNIYPKALGASCGPLASTILHEAVHLTELRLIEHGGLADACEASCFGWGSGDPAKCSEETLVRHGPRFAFGLRSGAGGSGALGRFGYEVIRSWTGTAFSLGLRLDVPLTNRESFVRAGLEVGTNFQLLGLLYGRLFGGLATPLPLGTSSPSTFVGTGLGFDFGRAQLEVLYDVLDLQSRDERTHHLMLGMGFRFGK